MKTKWAAALFGCLLLASLAACGQNAATTAPIVAQPPMNEVLTTEAKPASVETTSQLTEVSPAPTSSTLWLDLTPAEDITVSDPDFSLTGQAPENTVVSVNDEVLVVDESGQFQIQLHLEDGPNLIEVLASSADGQEIWVELVVTLEAGQ